MVLSPHRAGVRAPLWVRGGNAIAVPDHVDLLKELELQLAERTYDVALIAAGGLDIPLAASVKRAGRTGISLGGHLQVLFGVLGERWRGKRGWSERYFNDAWVDLPERYIPSPGESTENYW